MELNLGSRGATTQSWERDTWRVAFKEVLDANPGASEKILCNLMVEVARDDLVVLRSAIAINVRNSLEALEGYKRRQEEREVQREVKAPPPQRTPEQIAERQAEIATAVRKDIETILQLNQIMPNGKRLRYCTGIEVTAWGKGYAAIGKRAGHKLIGEVLDEQAVRNLLGVS